jgi:hypothetical protein
MIQSRKWSLIGGCRSLGCALKKMYLALGTSLSLFLSVSWILQSEQLSSNMLFHHDVFALL